MSGRTSLTIRVINPESAGPFLVFRSGEPVRPLARKPIEVARFRRDGYWEGWGDEFAPWQYPEHKDPRPRAGGAVERRGDRFPAARRRDGTMTKIPDYEFRTSSACQYNNNDPRCVEVATNVPGTVVVRSSVTGKGVEFTSDEWTDFLSGAKLGEFDLSA